MPPRGAFTLVDLALALAILGVVLGIAVPRFAGSIARYRLDAATWRVRADLALAQSNARLTGSNQAVVFNLAANQVQLPGYIDPDHPGLPYKIDFGRAPYQATLVGANFSGGNTVTYNGFGVPLAGGAVVIQVGAVQRTVCVNGVTGKTSIQ
jgi:type II secretory pathway pseudopilin PulG